MEYVVLGLLVIQSLTLYELHQVFTQGISMFYSASYGSLQVAAKNLLKKGLVSIEERVEKGRNKKVYHITEAGKQAFYAWMLAEIPLNKLEVTALAKVYFLGLIPEVEQRKEIIRQILTKIELMQNELNALNEGLSQIQVPESYKTILKYQLSTLDYGVKAHASGREWFLDLLNDLDSETG